MKIRSLLLLLLVVVVSPILNLPKVNSINSVTVDSIGSFAGKFSLGQLSNPQTWTQTISQTANLEVISVTPVRCGDTPIAKWVTVNNINATFVRRDATPNRCPSAQVADTWSDLWYLTNPPSGTVTLSTGFNMTISEVLLIGSASFNNVDLTLLSNNNGGRSSYSSSGLSTFTFPLTITPNKVGALVYVYWAMNGGCSPDNLYPSSVTFSNGQVLQKQIFRAVSGAGQADLLTYTTINTSQVTLSVTWVSSNPCGSAANPSGELLELDPIISPVRVSVTNGAFFIGSLFIVVAICASLNMVGLLGRPPERFLHIDSEHNKNAFVTVFLFLVLGVILMIGSVLFP